MKKLLSILVFATSILLSRGTARAQLAPPNASGVTMGHVHLNVVDVEASKKLWLSLGGTAAKLGPNEVVKFPNVLIILRKADPLVVPAEPIVNHLGFLVRDGQDFMAKWKAAGARIEPNANGRTGYVYTPEGERFEILERTTILVPIQFDQVHFFVPEDASGGGSIADMLAWYAKLFGAQSTAANLTAAIPWQAEYIPGVNLRFSKSDAPTTGTKGRALDHIGFEIQNLEEFCRKAEAAGVKFDIHYTKRPDLGISLAFLTDPRGTYIELNEGLNKL